MGICLLCILSSLFSYPKKVLRMATNTIEDKNKGRLLHVSVSHLINFQASYPHEACPHLLTLLKVL